MGGEFSRESRKAAPNALLASLFRVRFLEKNLTQAAVVRRASRSSSEAKELSAGLEKRN
jgi:hypothetical protein